MRSRRWPFYLVGALLLVAFGSGLGYLGLRVLEKEDAEPAARSAASEDRREELTEASVERLLNRYAEAYSAEDSSTLGRLLDRDLVRLSQGEPQQDREAALAEYTTQFQGLDAPLYALGDIRVRVHGDAADAEATYSITDEGSSVGSGVISFHVTTASGKAVIDEIYVVPQATRAPTTEEGGDPEPAQTADERSDAAEGSTGSDSGQKGPPPSTGPTVCPLIYGQRYCFDYQAPSTGSEGTGGGPANPNYNAPRHPRYPALQGPDPQSDYGPGIYR